jgi:hypothetical protein
MARLTLRLDGPTRQRLEAEAEARQTTASGLARVALEDFLDRRVSDGGVPPASPASPPRSAHDPEACAAALLALCPPDVGRRVRQASERTGRSPAQVLIAWLISQVRLSGRPSPWGFGVARPRLREMPSWAEYKRRGSQDSGAIIG